MCIIQSIATIMRITNMLFVVAAATSVSLQGCGTSSKDLENQVQKIKKDVSDLHSSEETLLDFISLGADKAPAPERRNISKLLSAMYKKDLPVDPISDEEWQAVRQRMKIGVPKALHGLIDQIDQGFAQMTPEQKTRLKLAINDMQKRYNERAKRLAKGEGKKRHGVEV
jgi:hypothetical protein